MASGGLSYRVSKDVVIVDLQGKLEIYTLTEVQETVQSLIDSAHHRIIFNMEKVPYLDSPGVGALFLIAKRLRALNGDLKLLHLSPSVKALLQVTRVIPLIDVFDSEDAAVAAFDGAAH